jgi:hypothetical protein
MKALGRVSLAVLVLAVHAVMVAALLSFRVGVTLTLPWWVAVAVPAAFYVVLVPMSLPRASFARWVAAVCALFGVYAAVAALAGAVASAVTGLPYWAAVGETSLRFLPVPALQLFCPPIALLPFRSLVARPTRRRSGARRHSGSSTASGQSAGVAPLGEGLTVMNIPRPSFSSFAPASAGPAPTPVTIDAGRTPDMASVTVDAPALAEPERGPVQATDVQEPVGSPGAPSAPAAIEPVALMEPLESGDQPVGREEEVAPRERGAVARVSFARVADQLPADAFSMSLEALGSRLVEPGCLLVPLRLVLPQLTEGQVTVDWEDVADQFPTDAFALSPTAIRERIPDGLLLLPLDELIGQLPPEAFALPTSAVDVAGLESFPLPFQPQAPEEPAPVVEAVETAPEPEALVAPAVAEAPVPPAPVEVSVEPSVLPEAGQSPEVVLATELPASEPAPAELPAAELPATQPPATQPPATQPEDEQPLDLVAAAVSVTEPVPPAVSFDPPVEPPAPSPAPSVDAPVSIPALPVVTASPATAFTYLTPLVATGASVEEGASIARLGEALAPLGVLQARVATVEGASLYVLHSAGVQADDLMATAARSLPLLASGRAPWPVEQLTLRFANGAVVVTPIGRTSALVTASAPRSGSQAMLEILSLRAAASHRAAASTGPDPVSTEAAVAADVEPIQVTGGPTADLLAGAVSGLGPFRPSVLRDPAGELELCLLAMAGEDTRTVGAFAHAAGRVLGSFGDAGVLGPFESAVFKVGRRSAGRPDASRLVVRPAAGRPGHWIALVTDTAPGRARLETERAAARLGAR